jgi:hypothetical protein
MTYYSTEEAHEDIRRLAVDRLSDEVVQRLLDGPAVRSQLERGADPAALSIEKWVRIREVYRHISGRFNPVRFYRHIGEYTGYRTCALCVHSTTLYERAHGPVRYGKDRCTLCPLAKVDCCLDDGSIFAQIDRLLAWTADQTTTDAEKEAAHTLLGKWIDCMIVNLQSLESGNI